jgi:fructuronate reductase
MAVTVGLSTLSLGTLSQVPVGCQPRVRPGDVPAGIVHLGLGAFHRAHQAVYTEDAIAEAGGDWAVIGVAPRRPELIAKLAAQDGLFSVTSLDGAGERTRVVGALAGVRHAPSDPDAIVALLADPAIRVVTLTVTEKAYRMDPASGRLQTDDALLADLLADRPPATVPGLLVRGLLARWRADAGPIALVSCDNLPSNGRRLHGLVGQAFDLLRNGVSAGRATGGDPGTGIQSAGFRGAGSAGFRGAGSRGAGVHSAGIQSVADWLRANVTYPSTMVDRIVPATTGETLARARAALGVDDLAAVAAEPFSQWVIEDTFPGGRPAWERAGAILTDDVGSWERLKLRALNGVHSALAYLGALAGCETIADALRVPQMRTVLEQFIADDIAFSFTPPRGVSVVEYGQSVLERFANPAICHRTLQVAMDGSQKLPQRVLHTVIDLRAAGRQPLWATLVIAAWMRFVCGRADDGRVLPLDDPLADSIRAALAAADGSPALVADVLFGLSTVFPAGLAQDTTVRELVVEWLTTLDRHGVPGALSRALGEG